MGHKLEDFHSRGVKIGQHVEVTCRISTTRNQEVITNIIQIQALKDGRKFMCHQKIVPNSEDKSANKPKPNPGQRYDAVQFSQRKKIFCYYENVVTMSRKFLECTSVILNI